jgi:hypothetical protein
MRFAYDLNGKESPLNIQMKAMTSKITPTSRRDAKPVASFAPPLQDGIRETFFVPV